MHLQKQRRNMDRRHISQIILHHKVLLTAVILLFIVIAVIAVGLCLPVHKPAVQGQLETTDYRVATKVPSRVVRLCVREGQRVRRGDTLAVLSAPELNAMETTTEARAEAAAAGDELVRSGTRHEMIMTAYERLQQAIADEDICSKSFARQEALFRQGVASEQKRDEARSKWDAAKAKTAAAREQYKMALAGARTEEKKMSRATVKTSAARTGEVKALLKETVLTAPQDGVVTEVFVEPDEIVGTGAPVMNVETDEAWFTFYVTEDKLRGFDYGSSIRIMRPATGDTVTARVTRINNAGDFASWKATRALDDIDLKVFEVRATPVRKIKSPHGGESALLIR